MYEKIFLLLCSVFIKQYFQHIVANYVYIGYDSRREEVRFKRGKWENYISKPSLIKHTCSRYETLMILVLRGIHNMWTQNDVRGYSLKYELFEGICLIDCPLE